ncbi:MAG: hypothetical protein I3I98_08450 [Mobilibacterium timonense]|uniref:hypothetical protein n=1 Tax=Mobilibacterium timonense TaxID=1871012 RepID=UPI0009875BE9|nr:hypothetical protein [Mobilibacterium timonense]MBM6991403.1 hypothetical protein [Mobilibacterium timonense]
MSYGENISKKHANDQISQSVKDSGLSQGVFWITDLDDIRNNTCYCFPIPCTPDGVNTGDTSHLDAKSGATYNHEKLWSRLPSELTHNRPFDHYPRGRVQIRNGKAVIFLNPNIATEEVKDFIIGEFHLTSENGIHSVSVKADGSSHYMCHLDQSK